MEGEARLWPLKLIFVHQLPSMLQWRKGVCSAWLAQTDQSPHSVSPCPLGSLPGPQLCVKDKLRLWLTTEGRFLQSLICYSSKPATFTRSLPRSSLVSFSFPVSFFFQLSIYLSQTISIFISSPSFFFFFASFRMCPSLLYGVLLSHFS